MRSSTLVCHGRWALVLALVLPACANRGMEAPDPGGTGGSVSTGGNGSGGVQGTGGSAGRGGTTGTGGIVSTGGTTGTGGKGGTTGTGGTVSTGGTPGTGGTIATGGTPGTGGAGTGGAAGGGGGGNVGTGGQAGSSATGGTGGAGGGAAGGGGTGTGGGGGGGGAAGAPAGGSGGHGGTSGASGAGGAAACVVGASTLDCSATGALPLTPDGMVTDFSASQWSPTAMAWCNSDGLTGSTFGYLGGSTTPPPVVVDTAAANPNLKMNLTVGANGYAGGGILFNSCVNASGFNALSFSAVVTSGSLTNCTWLVQLQTQDQRPSDATNPGGGTCNRATTTCYNSPAVSNLAAPTTTGMKYTELFTAFMPMSTIPMATQIVGVQWQVNGSPSAGCTVELRVDDIKFVTQ